MTGFPCNGVCMSFVFLQIKHPEYINMNIYLIKILKACSICDTLDVTVCIAFLLSCSCLVTIEFYAKLSISLTNDESYNPIFCLAVFWKWVVEVLGSKGSLIFFLFISHVDYNQIEICDIFIT